MARFLTLIDDAYGDIRDQKVGIFGIGSGILIEGCQQLGGKHISAFDIDSAIISRASEMWPSAEFILIDIPQLQRLHSRHAFDSMIFNPPFGTVSHFSSGKSQERNVSNQDFFLL